MIQKRLEDMELEKFLKSNESNAIKYDFSCDGADSAYCNLHDMEKFSEYQSSKPKYTKTKHPDSNSKMLQNIYKVLWDIDKYPGISKQNGEISGETLNSVNTTLKELFAFLDEDKEIRRNYGPHQQASALLFLSEYENKKSKIRKNVSEMNEALIAFVNSYHTLGNFMPTPVGCNGPRGSSNVHDYWDLTLYHIYNYYDKEDYEGIKKIIGSQANNIENYTKWLDSFDGWHNFIEKNYLESFVQCKNEDYYPKELWKCHFEQYQENKVYPNDCKQYKEYFENASKWIATRGKIMMQALRNKMEENEI